MLEPTTPNIFQAVRQGDIEAVRYLVEVQAEALQQHDEWDATPLYYAAYSGNKELVKFLLSVGAKCEEKTFDGERCLYAALNDDVRHLLLDEGFKRAGARGHDLFLDFVGKVFNVPEAYPDLTLDFGDETVHAHKFLLAVRAPAIGTLFGDSWRKQQTHLAVSTGHTSAALQALLRWFYTCRLDIAYDAVPACLDLCQQVQLNNLVDEAKSVLDSEAGKTLQHLPFRGSSLVIEPPREAAKQQLQDCLERVVAIGCSSLLEEADQALQQPCPSSQQQQQLFFDLCLVLDHRQCLCHRSFMSRRSDYFSTMLGSSFQEGSAASGAVLQIQVTDVEPDVLYAALQWVYTDRVDADMPADQLLQLMQYGDRALMEGLKGRCAMLLHPHVAPDSALPLLQQAMAMDSDRLADSCARCIAQHLLELVREPLFNKLIKESAMSVQNREDVDSVPIIDDIRYHVTLLHGDGELSDDEEDMDVLDPAQLATAYAESMGGQQQQQLQPQLPHHLQQQQPEQLHLQLRRQDQLDTLEQLPKQQLSDYKLVSREQQHQHRGCVNFEPAQTAPGQTTHAVDQSPAWLQVEQSDEEEEELICMDDPRFAGLSERRQKLMALEEVLLNSGIEG